MQFVCLVCLYVMCLSVFVDGRFGRLFDSVIRICRCSIIVVCVFVLIRLPFVDGLHCFVCERCLVAFVGVACVFHCLIVLGFLVWWVGR